MKLKELNEAIAAACNVRANVVSQVQNETFCAVRAAIDKGKKGVVPDFGIFLIKDVPGEEGAPGKKVMRFKARSGDKSGKAKKEKRKGKTAGAEGKGAAAGSDDKGGED